VVAFGFIASTAPVCGTHCQLSLASLWGHLIEYQHCWGKCGNVTSARCHVIPYCMRVSAAVWRLGKLLYLFSLLTRLFYGLCCLLNYLKFLQQFFRICTRIQCLTGGTDSYNISAFIVNVECMNFQKMVIFVVKTIL